MNSHYWCHQCRHQVTPTASLACSQCGSEFIEEVTGADPMDQDRPEDFIPFGIPLQPENPFLPNLNQAEQPPQAHQHGGAPPPVFQNLFQALGQMFQQQQAPQPQAQQQQQPPLNQNQAPPHPIFGQAGPQGQIRFQFVPLGGGPNNFVYQASFNTAQAAPGAAPGGAGAQFGNPFQRLFEQLLGGGFGGGGGAPVFGDYVLGENIDNLLNQLFQQQGHRGAPPASKQAVEKLPSKTLTEEDAKRYEECAICKGNFVDTDVVREMPCAHVYHPECICKWLEQRNFCPLCRFELPTDDPDYERQHNRAPPQSQSQQHPPSNNSGSNNSNNNSNNNGGNNGGSSSGGGSSASTYFPPHLDVD